MGGVKRDEKLGLGDVVNMQLDEVLQCFTIHPLQGIETPNVK